MLMEREASIAVKKRGTRKQMLTEAARKRRSAKAARKRILVEVAKKQRSEAQSKIHNDYENDVVEIPVVKNMRFKFNRPTKLEFV